MMKNLNSLVPGCSATMKLWLRLPVRSPAKAGRIYPPKLLRWWTLLRSYRSAATQNTKVTEYHHEHNVVSLVPSLCSSCSKKFLFFLFFLCLLVKTINAQSLIDTTYRTTYYDQKVSQFRLLPNTKNEIIFLGNSISDIGEWAEIWNNINVKNRGISGDNTFGVLARLDEVVSSKPAKVFILIGINDIAKNTPDSVIVSNYQKIVQRIRSSSHKTKIYIQSILPTNNHFTEYIRHQNKNDHIRFVNEGLRNLCKKQKLVYVDLYSGFLNDEGQLNEKYTNDGLHLTGAGYLLWKTILIQKGYMK